MKKIVLCLIVLSQLAFANERIDSGYDETFVALVEYIYGEGYLSQGGSDSVYAQFDAVELEGKKVLDIGCGMGGPDLDLAKSAHVNVIGIDPEDFLINEAWKRHNQNKHLLKGDVDFQLTHNPFVLTQFESNAFDIVTSREALLHIPFSNKEDFFKEIFRVTKSNGDIILLDWIRKRPLSQDTLDMMEMDGVAYNLNTLEEYTKILKLAGFKNIQIVDGTSEHLSFTDENINRIASSEEEFKKLFGEENYNYSLLSWELQKKAFQKNEIQVIKITAKKA